MFVHHLAVERVLRDERAPDQLLTSNYGCQHQYTFS